MEAFFANFSSIGLRRDQNTVYSKVCVVNYINNSKLDYTLPCSPIQLESRRNSSLLDSHRLEEHSKSTATFSCSASFEAGDLYANREHSFIRRLHSPHELLRPNHKQTNCSRPILDSLHFTCHTLAHIEILVR